MVGPVKRRTGDAFAASLVASPAGETSDATVGSDDIPEVDSGRAANLSVCLQVQPMILSKVIVQFVSRSSHLLAPTLSIIGQENTLQRL